MNAFWPRPRCAKARQISTWFAPPYRITSAASIELRASIMVGAVGSISIASNTSWIQRRLPGQFWEGSSPAAHWAWRPASPAGKSWLYLSIRPCLTELLIATQISPSEWTSLPATS